MGKPKQSEKKTQPDMFGALLPFVKSLFTFRRKWRDLVEFFPNFHKNCVR